MLDTIAYVIGYGWMVIGGTALAVWTSVVLANLVFPYCEFWGYLAMFIRNRSEFMRWREEKLKESTDAE